MVPLEHLDCRYRAHLPPLHLNITACFVQTLHAALLLLLLLLLPPGGRWSPPHSQSHSLPHRNPPVQAGAPSLAMLGGFCCSSCLLRGIFGAQNVGAPLSPLTEISCPHCHPGGWKTGLPSLDAIFSHYFGNLCPEYICLGAETCEMF